MQLTPALYEIPGLIMRKTPFKYRRGLWLFESQVTSDGRYCVYINYPLLAHSIMTIYPNGFVEFHNEHKPEYGFAVEICEEALIKMFPALAAEISVRGVPMWILDKGTIERAIPVWEPYRKWRFPNEREIWDRIYPPGKDEEDVPF